MSEQPGRTTVDLEAVGSRLARRRGAAGLTQVELAVALTRLLQRPFSNGRVCNIEKGKVDPGVVVHETWMTYCREVAKELDKA